ncbi:MAG: GNAT family N-acetyltransferase [Actinomycetales bacterium]
MTDWPAEPPELAAAGAHVHVRTVRAEDIEPYRQAVQLSADRLRRWNPVSPDDLGRHLVAQSPDYRTFMVLANEPEAGQPLVGRANLTNAVRGRFRSVAMGYDAYDPYAGRGWFGEGLRLVLDLALRDEADGGMGLHRVEANVQPGNVASAGLLRSLGLRHEGYSPRYLYLADSEGVERWRDHHRYAITREEWPGRPYAEPSPRPIALWLLGGQTQQGAKLGRHVSHALALPLLSASQAGLADIIRDSPAGAVVLAPSDAEALPVDVAAAAAFTVWSVDQLAAAHGVAPGAAWRPRDMERVVLALRALPLGVDRDSG